LNLIVVIYELLLVADRWFSASTPNSPTNKTNRHEITEVLLKVAFKTLTMHCSFYSFASKYTGYIILHNMKPKAGEKKWLT